MYVFDYKIYDKIIWKTSLQLVFFLKYPKDNGLINSNQDIVIVHILLGTYVHRHNNIYNF